MAISPECLICEEELTEPGAIVLSPPLADGVTVAKGHICVTCWDRLEAHIEEIAGERSG